MTYYKQEIGPYNLHLIKTDKFKTVQLQINFKRKTVREEITARNLLTYVLMGGNAVYPSKRALELATEELYGMNCGVSSFLSGKYSVLSFQASFLLERYSEPGMMDASIEFLLDLIFKPYVQNKAFVSSPFTIAKNALKELIETEQDDPKFYSQTRLLEEMEDGIFSFHSNGYQDDLEKITEKSLYTMYESVLKSDLVDIFIVGDIDIDLIKKIIREKFPVNTIKKKGESHVLPCTKYRHHTKTVKEKRPFNQSKLMMGCKLDNLTDFERKYVLTVYNFILGGSPDSKLFLTVREKHSLCYYISCSSSQVKNLMMIKSGINRHDFKKVTSLVKKEMKNMELGKFEDAEIAKAQITYISSCKELSDQVSDVVSTYVAKEYLQADLLDQRMEEIMKVTKEMIVNLSKKVHLDTIYFLEGGSDNEEDTSL